MSGIKWWFSSMCTATKDVSLPYRYGGISYPDQPNTHLSMPTPDQEGTPPDVALAFVIFLLCCGISFFQSNVPFADTLSAWLLP